MHNPAMLQRILWRSAIVAAMLVCLGALDHGTRRVSREPGVVSTVEEGAHHWAAVALLCGLLAAGALWRARSGETWHPMMLRVSAILLLVPVIDSGQHWLRLLDERDDSVGYDLFVATGLPATVTASVVGLSIVILLLSSTLRDTTRRQRSPNASGLETRSQ